MQGKIGEGKMEDDSGMVMGVECVKPGQDGDIELDESGYWNVGLSTGVGGSCGVGGKVGVDSTDCVGNVCVGDGCGNSDNAGSIDGVHCVGVVSESSSGGFCGSGGTGRFWTGVCSSWRMVLQCWNKRGERDFLGCLSLMSVAGNMFVAVGACLLEIVTQCRFF